MELKQVEKIINNIRATRAKKINSYAEALRYYRNENDITKRNGGKSELNKDGNDDPIRKADNRVSSNFYQLLVDQEAGYVATKAPQIDVGDDKDNQAINDVLGDDFGLTIHNLVVDAANGSEGWLHYWIDDDGMFRFAIIPPDQIDEIYSTTLDNKLVGLLRSYKQLNEETGDYEVIHEFWNDTEAQFFREKTTTPVTLEPFDCINSVDISTGFETGASNIYSHGFGRIPFIAFPKNKSRLPELHKIKGLIDAYDDVYNGFLNDVDDIQQVILVLKNYGGTDLDTFMRELKEKKAIKFNNAGNGDQSGVDTLQIDIPTEARDKILTLTKNDIFLQGQGIDPANFANTNASGVAIKMLYSHLELKASNTESYFRRSVSELVRAIMRYLGLSDPEGRHILQTWTRTRVEDDLTQAQTVATVANYSSNEAIAKANPLVDDWQRELKDRQKDSQDDGFSIDYQPDQDKQDQKKKTEGLEDE